MNITRKKLRQIIVEEAAAVQQEQQLIEEEGLLTENPIAAVVLNLLKNPQVMQMLATQLMPILMGGEAGTAGSTGTGGRIGGGGPAPTQQEEE